jgi:hypothetical protein
MDGKRITSAAIVGASTDLEPQIEMGLPLLLMELSEVFVDLRSRLGTPAEPAFRVP